VKLFLLDDEGEDGSSIAAPQQIKLEALVGDTWKPLATDQVSLNEPVGRRPTVVHFSPILGCLSFPVVSSPSLQVSKFFHTQNHGSGFSLHCSA
jgi:hypothetical protein